MGSWKRNLPLASNPLLNPEILLFVVSG